MSVTYTSYSGVYDEKQKKKVLSVLKVFLKLTLDILELFMKRSLKNPVLEKDLLFLLNIIATIC